MPDLEKEMIKIIRSQANFDEIPIVKSISLCFDLSEMEKINQRREILMAEFEAKYEEDP